MIREIVQEPDPRLYERSIPIVEVGRDELAVAHDMLDTMRKWKGLGLAAVQIGVMQRIIVLSPRSGSPFTMMFNPEIFWRSGDTHVQPEGCLSLDQGVPRLPVRRSQSVRVRFLDRAGVRQELKLNGLVARTVQHEVDHLDGIVISAASRKAAAA